MERCTRGLSGTCPAGRLGRTGSQGTGRVVNGMGHGMAKATNSPDLEFEAGEPALAARDRADHMKTRVCWLYYMEGKTQDDIAHIVGISRSKVLRILSLARADGSVQVTVTARLSRCRELEGRLERRFGLTTAIVVPAPQNPADVSQIIGRRLGGYLSRRIRSGMTVGLGWGNTLTASLPSVERREPSGVSVISMLGGLTKVDRVNPCDFAWRFANRLSAECYMIAAPVFAPDAAVGRSLMDHGGIAEVFDRARRLDLAVVSVGNWEAESLFGQYGLLGDEEIASLEKAGAVGNVLCRFIDADGRVIDHPVNDRVLAIHPADLRGAKEVVLASGGESKIAAIRAALRLLGPNVLITDSIVAEHLASGPADGPQPE